MKRIERMTIRSLGTSATLGAAFVALTLAAGSVVAQSAAPAEPKPAESAPSDAGPLAPLAWLEGCWRGTVNKREFREHWMPLRGNLLVGMSHTVAEGKTVGYEFLRIEPRTDGIFYVAGPSGKSEAAFRLTEQTSDRSGDRRDELFGFVNPELEFPRKITYRQATDGWLYAVVEGKINGADRLVTYPMRRIDCESGELILK